jgi:hypothetical protein
VDHLDPANGIQPTEKEKTGIPVFNNIAENPLPSLVVLMIESEQPEGLSARKLVVETAKHNVLTAYSAEDGLGLLRKFPNVDVILVHGPLAEQHPDLLPAVREQAAEIPIILAAPFGNMSSPYVNYVVDSHHPEDLLTLLVTEIRPRPFA